MPIIASAAALVVAFVACSIAVGVRSAPVGLVSRLDIAPASISIEAWGEPWEALARHPLDYQREALEVLSHTTARLGLGAAVVALLSLLMHGAGRILADWRPLAIRCALGAPLRTLARQVVGDLTLLGATGGVLGAVASAVMISWLRVTWPALLTQPPLLMPAALGAAAALGVAMIALAGVTVALLYPLQRRVRAVADLHGDHVTASNGLLFLQTALTVFQLVALLAVTYGCLLVVRAADAGDLEGSLPWTPQEVALGPATLPAARGPVAVASRDAWVGLSPELPVLAECGSCFIGPRLVPMTSAVVRWAAIAPGSLSAMSLGVVRGRDLGAADSAGAVPVIIVSRAAAYQLFPGADPIGKRLLTGFSPGHQYRVVGVSGDFAPSGLGMSGATLPMVYVPLAQHAPPSVERSRPGIAGGLSDGEGRLADRVALVRAPLAWFGRLFGLLASGATVLGLLSLATSMAELVEIRRRDIATRLALGAPPRHIVTWVLGKALAMTLAGLFVGLIAARWIGELVGRHLRAAFAGDLWLLAQLGVAFAVVGLGAALIPARRAARLPPAAILADPPGR